MARQKIVLVAMPWDFIEYPSIQLGTLTSLLAGSGIDVEPRSLKLDFLKHCITASADCPDGERIGVEEYNLLASDMLNAGLGEWTFAVPPFRDTAALDEAYFGRLRGRGVSDREIQLAHRVRQLVPGYLDHCLASLLEEQPAAIGFTTTFHQTTASLALAMMIKERAPEVRILFGGANCDGAMGAAIIRCFPFVDVVVRGEAEQVLVPLVRDLLGGKPVRPAPGLCYRDGAGVHVEPATEAASVQMDEVPLPDFQEYFTRMAETELEEEISPRLWLPYESARGCWWSAKAQCKFCGLAGTRRTFRSKRPDRVVDEICRLAAQHQILHFHIVDLIQDEAFYDVVVPKLCERGFDLRMFCDVRCTLGKEQVRLLKEAGFRSLQPGVESLSTPILKRMSKGTTALQNIRLLKWCAEFGIEPVWNILYGFPGEPPEEYARMAELTEALVHLTPPAFAPFRLDRFSPYHSQPEANAVKLLGPSEVYAVIYPVAQEDLNDLAYSFSFRAADGNDPESYVGACREAVERWRGHHPAAQESLSLYRGPGFLRIVDRRASLGSADYVLAGAEAQIYLCCDGGATVRDVQKHLVSQGAGDFCADEITEFLGGLVEQLLLYEERGRYLSLAVPVS